jgi:hypothetical protein
MAGRQSWDYLVIENIRPERLSELGTEGWELACAAPAAGGARTAFYFKRPAADLRERVTLDHRQRFAAGTARPLGSGEAQ